MTLPVVAVMCAPFRRRTNEDAALLLTAKRWLVERGTLPLFLPDTLTGVLDDESPREREATLGMSEAFVRHVAGIEGSAMIVAADRVTEGMERDIAAWLDACGRDPLHFWSLVDDDARVRFGRPTMTVGEGGPAWRCTGGHRWALCPDVVRYLCPDVTCRRPVAPAAGG